MKTICCKITDKGSIKKKNQDSSFVGSISSDSAFGIICDGVGSYNSSEIASGWAVSVFSDWFLKCYACISGIEDKETFRSVLYERWNAIFDSINEHIIRFAEINGIKLACTLSCILIKSGSYYILHIGDTRIYRISSEITRLTEDHTVMERNIRRKLITREQAQGDRSKHVLTKCLASRRYVSPDFYSGNIDGTTKFLICSDGFCNNAEDERILRMFGADARKSTTGLRKAAKKIIRSDRSRGERDNITAVIIQVSKE